MTVADARQLVESWLPDLVDALGLGYWAISVSYERSPEADWRAACSRQVSYCVAEIELDAESYEDPAKLFFDLRHELLHVVLSPFDIYTDFAAGFGVGDATVTHQEGCLRRFATEQTLLNLERVLFCLEKGRGDLFMPRVKDAGPAGRADTGEMTDPT